MWYLGKLTIQINIIVICVLKSVTVTEFCIFILQGHSHQLFHLLVIAAAFVHYHGISEMAMHRLAYGECEDHPYETKA